MLIRFEAGGLHIDGQQWQLLQACRRMRRRRRISTLPWRTWNVGCVRSVRAPQISLQTSDIPYRVLRGEGILHILDDGEGITQVFPIQSAERFRINMIIRFLPHLDQT